MCNAGPGYGGGCVTVDTILPNGKRAGDLKVGDEIMLGTEDLDHDVATVRKIVIRPEPCVRVETRSGVSLVCSTSAPIFTSDKEYTDAPDLLGKYVAIYKDGGTMFDEVISVTSVGHRDVAVIDAGDKAFWAGETTAGYMLHHNITVHVGFIGGPWDAVGYQYTIYGLPMYDRYWFVKR